jgi:hypothetical protein
MRTRITIVTVPKLSSEGVDGLDSEDIAGREDRRRDVTMGHQRQISKPISVCRRDGVMTHPASAIFNSAPSTGRTATRTAVVVVHTVAATLARTGIACEG